MAYQRTTATEKILKLNQRIRGIGGGTSASKTISILLWLIDYAQTHNNQLISVVSETFPHLRRGAMRDFLDIMETHQYYIEKEWDRTNSTYTFTKTKSRIEFFSADQSSKVRGPRRDILFINEANNIEYETYTQLEIRTNKLIFLDWNPVNEFWFYTEVCNPDQDGKCRKKGVDFLTLTYRDNEALTQPIIDSIEGRKTNKNWYKVYGLGQLGDIEGRIYSGWQYVDEVPFEARLERRGLDFGYSNDPTAVISIYYYNGGYILNEELYRKGLSNKQIADVINNLPNPGTVVICDSAEPKSIDELRLYGINAIPTTKGRDSVVQGIQFVQDQQISITKRSVNTIKEYRNYMWDDRDKDQDVGGAKQNKPVDMFNHSMDALRYGFDGLRPVNEEMVWAARQHNKNRRGAWGIG